MLRVRSKLGAAGLGAVILLTLTGCLEPAGDDSATATTLRPLIQTSYATLSPATSTTLATAIDGAQTTVAAATQGTSVAPPMLPSTTTSIGALANPGTDASDSSVPSAGERTYTVVARDTVFGIARRYGITAPALAELNDWADGITHPIYPGDKIKVPRGASTPPPPTTGDNSSATTTSTTVAAGPGGTYVIVAGDYLAGIAAKNDTTVQAIVAVNGWPDGDKHLIVPGQTIKLPAP